MNVTVSRAKLSDRQDMVSLLTTPVNGTSPLDELKADWGADVVAYTAAQLTALIASGQMQAAVARDASNVIRGWILFAYIAEGALPVSDEGWQCILIVTDKSLALSDRLAVASRMISVSAAAAAASLGDPYIYGDIKTPGNLDTYCSTRLASFPHTVVTAGGLAVACNRYYGHASQLAQVFP